MIPQAHLGSKEFTVAVIWQHTMYQNIVDNACTLVEEDEDAYKKTFSTHKEHHKPAQRDAHESSCCCTDNAVWEKKPREGNKVEK